MAEFSPSPKRPNPVNAKKVQDPKIEIRVRFGKPFLYLDAPGFELEVKLTGLKLPDDRAVSSTWDPFLRELGTQVLQCCLKTHEAASTRLSRGERLPSPADLIRNKSKDYRLSITEFAALKGIDVNEIRRAADAGEIPCRKTRGGHRKFSIADL